MGLGTLSHYWSTVAKAASIWRRLVREGAGVADTMYEVA
jgi:hypothetical protein